MELFSLPAFSRCFVLCFIFYILFLLITLPMFCHLYLQERSLLGGIQHPSSWSLRLLPRQQGCSAVLTSLRAALAWVQIKWRKFVCACTLGRALLTQSSSEATEGLLFLAISRILNFQDIANLPSSSSPSRRIRWRDSLHSERPDVLKQGHLEARPLPDLRLWQRGHSLRQDPVPGGAGVRRPHHARWGVLPRVSTHVRRGRHQLRWATRCTGLLRAHLEVAVPADQQLRRTVKPLLSGARGQGLCSPTWLVIFCLFKNQGGFGWVWSSCV